MTIFGLFLCFLSVPGFCVGIVPGLVLWALGMMFIAQGNGRSATRRTQKAMLAHADALEQLGREMLAEEHQPTLRRSGQRRRIVQNGIVVGEEVSEIEEWV